MSKHWRWFILGYLWSVIMTMAGVFICHFIYKAHSWKWCDGILTCVAGGNIWGQPNAQTIGWVQVYDTEDSREEKDLRVHENTHVVQGFLFSMAGGVLGGLLFGLWGGIIGGFVGGVGFYALYAILFTYLYAKQGGGDWVTAYSTNPFEVHANKKQDEYLTDQTIKVWGA